MHRELRELLGEATGESELVIAVNADVRGFSRFSLEVESVETALFIRKIYRRLLDDYFSDADFFKPTGDGLLLVFRVDEQNLQERTQALVESSLRLVEEFPTLLSNEPIINFPVPEQIGVGLSRGAACRLISDDKVLDYSGKVLNLASRLMDIARPAGVVFDEALGPDLLSDELGARFTRDEVYVRSIAEKLPLTVRFSGDFTTISPMNKRPIHEVEWRRVDDSYTLADLSQISNAFRVVLPSTPLDPNGISVEASHPKVMSGGKKHPTMLSFVPVQWTYESEAQESRVVLKIADLAQALKKRGVRSTWKVDLVVKYPEQ